MVAGWRRVGAGLGLALAAVALTGCRVQGTFDVVSEERVALDLVVTGDDAQCANAAYVLKLSAATIDSETGERACRIYGETQATYFSPFGVTVSSAAEYLVFQTSISPGADGWPASDIHLRFPGQVISANRGIVVGNDVEINDLAVLGDGGGLRVVALSRPGPPVWVVAAALGVGAGIVLAFVVLGLLRYARRPRPVDPALVALEPADLPEDADAGADPADTSPPPPAETRPTEPSAFAPPAPDPAVPPEPPPEATDAASPRPGPEPAPDHTIWAPPPDRR
ncbi:MAG: hypothetical protein LCH96_18700 [Actinobacteria bacterium]|nr:hypothetical protein [Actinomycetota bacterium]